MSLALPASLWPEFFRFSFICLQNRLWSPADTFKWIYPHTVPVCEGLSQVSVVSQSSMLNIDGRCVLYTRLCWCLWVKFMNCLSLPTVYISCESKKLTIVNPAVIFGNCSNSTIAHDSHTAHTKPAHDVGPQIAHAIAQCDCDVFDRVWLVLTLMFAFDWFVNSSVLLPWYNSLLFSIIYDLLIQNKSIRLYRIFWLRARRWIAKMF